MANFRYFIEGLGTASGFCWPAYGFIIGTLALCGITSAVVTAGITCGVFLVVCPFVAYVLYKKNKNENKKFKEQIDQNQSEIDNQVRDYLLILTKRYYQQQNYLKRPTKNIGLYNFIIENINSEFSSNLKLNTYITKVVRSIFRGGFGNPNATSSLTDAEATIARHFTLNSSPSFYVHSEKYSVPNSGLSKWNKFTTGTLGFMCGLGSSAGFCAGASAPLVALGILTVSTMTILGPIALGVGLIAGFLIAKIYIQAEAKKHKMNNIVQHANQDILTFGEKIHRHELDLQKENKKELKRQLHKERSKNFYLKDELKKQRKFYSSRLFPKASQTTHITTPAPALVYRSNR